MSEVRSTEQQLHTCPDCKCQFVQPFLCTTCGAQKLYDETVRSQAATIEHMRPLVERYRKGLENIASMAPIANTAKYVRKSPGYLCAFGLGEEARNALDPSGARRG